MNQDKGKKYDLEDRTLEFAKGIIRLCKKLPKDVINLKLIDQLIRASGSVGANYIEASESLSKKDFVYRIRITRKEAKETTYWLELIKEANVNFEKEIDFYIQESRELRNIFTSILNKSTGK
jgi:four helix bundle protein